MLACITDRYSRRKKLGTPGTGLDILDIYSLSMLGSPKLLGLKKMSKIRSLD
jgi:hypothetical protein